MAKGPWAFCKAVSKASLEEYSGGAELIFAQTKGMSALDP